MRRVQASLVVVVVTLLSAAFVADVETANPEFNPFWVVGDTWSVRFSEATVQFPRRAGPSPFPGSMETVYRYTVAAESVNAGRNVITIEVRNDQPGWPTWSLNFDRDQVVLLSVEEVIDGRSVAITKNPFGDDAWMAEPNQFASPLIVDFPRVPDASAAEQRVIQPLLGRSGSVTQSTTFANGRATVVLSRAASEPSGAYNTRIEWGRGRKWWSSAQVRIGDNVRLSGVLVDQ